MRYSDFNMVANDARWAGEKEGMQRGYAQAKAESQKQISRISADNARMSERIAELEKQIKMRG